MNSQVWKTKTTLSKYIIEKKAVEEVDKRIAEYSSGCKQV